jgi:hypothetical protein
MPPKTDHDMLIDLHAAICGVNGQDGLLRSHKALKTDFYKFKTCVIIVFAFLLGSGALGFGIYELVKYL